MTLREEYAELGLHVPDEDIVSDTQDAFSYRTTGKRGVEMIIGYNRNTETFWRNRPEYDGE